MESKASRFRTAGTVVGLLATIAGILSALYLLAVLVVPYVSVSPNGINFIDTGSLNAANAPVVLFWTFAAIVASLIAGYSAWKAQIVVLWSLAILFSLFTVLGMLSIGLFFAPAAVLLVVAALLMTLDRRYGQGKDEAVAAI